MIILVAGPDKGFLRSFFIYIVQLDVKTEHNPVLHLQLFPGNKEIDRIFSGIVSDFYIKIIYIHIYRAFVCRQAVRGLWCDEKATVVFYIVINIADIFQGGTVKEQFNGIPGPRRTFFALAAFLVFNIDIKIESFCIGGGFEAVVVGFDGFTFPADILLQFR